MALPLRIGLTLGDPAGVGPEVLAAALQKIGTPHGITFQLYGKTTGITPGRLTKTSARVAWQALKQSTEAWRRGELDALVTGPIHKENMDRIGFGFPGHTEFLAHACGLPESRAVMMLTDPKLTVSLVTIHCSLRDAIRALSLSKIEYVTRVTHDYFVRLGKTQPRLAIAGLNPHAGENGMFGNEEARLIVPAIKKLRAVGLNVSGPFAPDTIFHRAHAGEFDGVICLYHDQGLIPFKLLAFHTGVNVTLGLPMIRTSPDHGTAVDLAGTGKADSRSMTAAIRLACRLAKFARPATPDSTAHA
jgi:4-hydroxythreonine-4-phosphate dehydrogenase